MKKYGGMMYPPKTNNNIKNCNCTGCGKELTPKTAYYYVDSCNFAITNNSQPYCKPCYIKKYGKA